MDLNPLWKLFTKKGGFTATCNTCHKDYNYRASTSNLRKHWNKLHGTKRKVPSSDVSESDRHISDNSDVEQDKVITDKKPKATWNYFDVVDSDKFEATCKICEKVVPFTSSSDLSQHIREEHDENPKDSDEEYVPVIPRENTFRRKIFKSRVWKYFTATNDTMAVCLLCKNLFNYGSTITNLRKHLLRKHKGATTPSREDREKQFRMGEDGILYEIEHLSGEEDNDDGNAEDPMATDTIYLNEEELDFIDDHESPTPSPKKPRITKTNYTKSPKEPIRNFQNTCSEEQLLPRNLVSTNTPSMTSIDYFGQYIVSMLKELPKAVSNQLQSVIVKQILTSKMALETPPVAAKYKINISKNNDSETNIPEPVTYTVLQSNGDIEKPNENEEV